MIRVAMIARSTLFTASGGDTVQVAQTARCLRSLGVHVDIVLANERIDYGRYDLLHLFNIIRPADLLVHVRRSGKPYVVSTIFVDYNACDRHDRKGIGGWLLRRVGADRAEYMKAIARRLRGSDALPSAAYLWKGHRRSVCEILAGARLLLPNSEREWQRLRAQYGVDRARQVITNGIDPGLFRNDGGIERDPLLVLCVARIEAIKNQRRLIEALRGTKYRLLLIGDHATNQLGYFQECRRIAGSHVSFLGQLPQHELLHYYRRAAVHVLPSWFETTGLSSLEAAAMGCPIVITATGDAKEYFGDHAQYCDPASPRSIREAIDRAAAGGRDNTLQQKIIREHTWPQAALQTLRAYHTVLDSV